MFHSGRGARGAGGSVTGMIVSAVAALLAGCSADAAGSTPKGPGSAAGARSSTGAADSGGCAEFAPAEPTTVNVSSRELASPASEGLSLTPLAPSLIAENSGAYWYGGDGAVFGLRREDSRARQLRAGTPPGDSGEAHLLVHGIAADEQHVVIAEAYLEPSSDPFPLILDPPGRLLSIPTDGGQPSVMLELDDGVITPVMFDAGRLIVFIQGEAGGFYALDPAGQLERLPIESQFFSGRRSGNTLYASNNDYPATLLSSAVDDAESVPLLELELPYFYVGPGRVLTRLDRLVEPEYTREDALVVHEPASNCARTLPSLGEAISYEVVVDAGRAYWLSYRTPETTVPDGASGPDMKLISASLTSGALTRLVPSGVVLDSSARILGQDDRALYVINGGALLALDKP